MPSEFTNGLLVERRWVLDPVALDRFEVVSGSWELRRMVEYPEVEVDSVVTTLLSLTTSSAKSTVLSSSTGSAVLSSTGSAVLSATGSAVV